MPAMGDSVAEGTVLEWRKQEGDPVDVDETLVEISTDKVDAEVPSPAAGTVVKIYAAEGETVAVGAVLAEISTNGGGASAEALAAPVSAESPPVTPEEAVAGAATEAAGAAAAQAATGELVDIVTPTGGESVTEGTIIEWSVKVGDAVKEGDTVVEISTDKVDMELPAPASGTIAEILAQDGETVRVGQVIARMTAGAGAEPKPRVDNGAPESGATAAGTPSQDGGANASPVARRVAAQQGVDLGALQGTARGGRIVKADVLAAKANGGNGATASAPPAPAPAPATVKPAPAAPVPAPAKPAAAATLIKGGAAALARYMDESRSIPTATSFRTLTVTALSQRREQLKQAGHRVSFTHLIAYAIARVATEDMAVMANHFAEIDGKPHRIDDAACNLGLAVDVEKKDGSRTLMVPVIRDAGRKSFKDFLDAYNALVEKARTNALTADDLSGGNLTLTNPGGIGTIASVPRLMVGQGTIVATGAIGYPPGLGAIGEAIGAEKVMTMTSTYDHRIIQGAESGRFLQRIEALLQGEDGFYERVFADLGVALGPLAPAPEARAITPPTGVPAIPDAIPAAAPGIFDEEMMQAVQAATSLLKAHRTHGHLAAKLDPLGREPEGDPALDPRPARAHPRVDGADPGPDPPHVRLRPDARRRAAEPARDLLRADRVRDRAHRVAPPASVAARGDRVGQVPGSAGDRGAEDAVAAADRGRRARAVHAQGLPRAEAVLDRGARHDRADARRVDPARGHARRARGRDRDGPPRPPQRARSQPRSAVRLDLRRVRGVVDARGDHDDSAGRHRRRQVPPRRAGLLPASERRVDHRPPRVQSVAPRVRRARSRPAPPAPLRPRARARTPTARPMPPCR